MTSFPPDVPKEELEKWARGEPILGAGVPPTPKREVPPPANETEAQIDQFLRQMRGEEAVPRHVPRGHTGWRVVNGELGRIAYPMTTGHKLLILAVLTPTILFLLLAVWQVLRLVMRAFGG